MLFYHAPNHGKLSALYSRQWSSRIQGLLHEGANRVGDSLDDSKKFERATQHRHPRPGGDGDGLRVFYRRCRRFFGSGGRIDNVCGSSRRRSWTRRWLGSWSRTRLGPWSRLGPRPGLGLHRAWLLLQPALGPHDLPVLIADQVIKHRRVRRFAGAPFF